MREVFQQELQEVQERLVEISGLVAVSIDNATRAFNESPRPSSPMTPRSMRPALSSTSSPSTSSPGSSRSPATFASS